MANETINRINEQFEKTVFGPARSYASIVTDHAEAVAGIQLEAAKAYTDLALQQVRAAADIRDVEGWKSYVAGQSEVAEDPFQEPGGPLVIPLGKTGGKNIFRR